MAVIKYILSAIFGGLLFNKLVDILLEQFLTRLLSAWKIDGANWVDPVLRSLDNPIATALVGAVIGISIAFVFLRSKHPKNEPLGARPVAVAGAGGSVTVAKGFGQGGPGGSVFGDSGLGGAGGNAHVGEGIGLGGEGGSVGSDRVWPAPARNGLHVLKNSRGLPVAIHEVMPGRGGAEPGYIERLAIVRRILQQDVQASNEVNVELLLHNPTDDLIAIVNHRLKAEGFDWKARIREHQIEFFAHD